MKNKVILIGLLSILILSLMLILNLNKTDIAGTVNNENAITLDEGVISSGNPDSHIYKGEIKSELEGKRETLESGKEPANHDFQIKNNINATDVQKQDVSDTKNNEIKSIKSRDSKSSNLDNSVDFADEKEKQTIKLSIDCKTILNNIEKFNKDKADILPVDGIILPWTDVMLQEGDTAFTVLIRVIKDNKMHIDFVHTPALGSSYIKGINNIYEFDCGDLSGWLYKVNGHIMSSGSSNYMPVAGDRIEWRYSCDLGGDLSDE